MRAFERKFPRKCNKTILKYSTMGKIRSTAIPSDKLEFCCKFYRKKRLFKLACKVYISKTFFSGPEIPTIEKRGTKLLNDTSRSSFNANHA